MKPLLQKSMSINIASLILGCASAIYWTFSKDYIATVPSNSDFITSSFWILVGVSGIIGGFSGGLISKFSIKTLYIIVVLMMATSILSLNIDNANLFIIFLSALFFGSSYVFLTGILMIWGIKIFEKAPSLGIGVPFFTLAFGQIIGAMVSGNVIQISSYELAFAVFGFFSLISIIFIPKV
ncbi:YbfB/YjiJ family MFS transporter [Staphylococcus shinii]|uniref:YbfB/YjiJ family MFS transporter n=1 Tax=Staphylococcus shinii TaxID=2912228 RepID=UPI00298EF551|nr:YbfB/YjiJ family MFS transporter [Staphylococcus shinii]MDW8563365.1 YbfB/YjiJ family MFS transporter [Staphylococcus shinii]MDW8566602.1 YbfB/YjiJ family MFS transporter [Staphylococcus shinii]